MEFVLQSIKSRKVKLTVIKHVVQDVVQYNGR